MSSWNHLLISLFVMIVHHSLLISQIAIRITFTQNLSFCHFYSLILVLHPKTISSFMLYLFQWLKKMVIFLPNFLSKIQCFNHFYCSSYNCFLKFDTKIIAFQLQALAEVCLGWIPALPSTSCVRSDQIRSVSQSCLTLSDPMNRSMPGLPVHHQLPEFTQTHVHRVSDAIQPSSVCSLIYKMGIEIILPRGILGIYVKCCVC